MANQLGMMAAGALAFAGSVSAQSPSGVAVDPVIFAPGTGTPSRELAPVIVARLSCAAFADAEVALTAVYSDGAQPSDRLDRILLGNALASYRFHNCKIGSSATGPAMLFVVNFARWSSQPRLYGINLINGDGLDRPIMVAHGIGSDPDDDGIAQSFSNAPDSLMSSLGAARGAEVYSGINGRSLRLDGLDQTNSELRRRDIVVHSYDPTFPRYFNASHVKSRGGRAGTSEGCLVVEPAMRDWVIDSLADGGFIYAGLAGRMVAAPDELLSQPAVVFVPGVGNQ